MIKQKLKRYLRKKHPWRTILFQELVEIYISMTLRSFGVSLIGIFVPVYLYKSGVSLPSMFLFYSLFYLMRVPLAFLSGKVVGQIGPKHSLAISNILFIVFLTVLLTFQEFRWPLVVVAGFYTMANSLFYVAYHTDFSKIKHSKHGGKELSWLYILEHFGAALGPITGGLIAGFLNPHLSILFAMAVIIGSLIPLFLTNEPIKLHQQVNFKNFPWRRVLKNDVIPLASLHSIDDFYDFWLLYIAVFIFTDNAYQAVGFIGGIAMLVSVVGARLFGRFVDNNHGARLLNWGIGANLMLSLSRALTIQPITAILVSAVSKVVQLSTKIPMTKAYYDRADSIAGHRISYISVTLSFSALLRGILFFAAWLLMLNIGVTRLNYQIFFVINALIGLGMIRQHFPALRKYSK